MRELSTIVPLLTKAVTSAAMRGRELISSFGNNTILDHYLGRELMWGIGVTLLSLISIAYFVTFAAEMGEIGQQDFTANTAVWYVLLKMPKIIQEMFPAATLVGGLFAFGGLAASNELTVMRATGLSVIGMLWQVRKGVILLLLVAVVNMEWVVPVAERVAKIVKATALHQPVMEYAGEAFWLRDGDDFVRMKNVEDDGVVAGVLWMKIPQYGELSEFSYAERASHQSGGWRLEEVLTTKTEPGKVTVTQLEQMERHSTVSEDMIKLASRSPADLSTAELLQYGEYLESNGLNASSYWHTFWYRMTMPLGLIVMLVLALPFSVTEGRSLSASKRVVIGVFVGAGFYLLNKVLMNTGEIYQFNPIVTVFTIPLLFLGAALWMIRRRGL